LFLSLRCPLQPGDCVILNAPNSTVGRTLLQLCKLLKLRAVAVLRCKPRTAAAAGAAAEADERFESVAEQLCGLGATLVLRDEGSVKVSMCTLWIDTGGTSCSHSSR
jgi:trans-2-enoyl-CoA reductase